MGNTGESRSPLRRTRVGLGCQKSTLRMTLKDKEPSVSLMHKFQCVLLSEIELPLKGSAHCVIYTDCQSFNYQDEGRSMGDRSLSDAMSIGTRVSRKDPFRWFLVPGHVLVQQS